MGEPDDLRQFIRDIATRHERIWREQAEMFRAMREEMRAAREEMRAEREEMRAYREESRRDHDALLNALLHVLDRLENGGAAA